jgi:hypothetical protein
MSGHQPKCSAEGLVEQRFLQRLQLPRGEADEAVKFGFVHLRNNYPSAAGMETPQIRISIGTIPSGVSTKLSERASPIQISIADS